ncbi:MAG: hypothetical protein KDG50_02865 [Chromatiales bacterium]|nr:hypothetical protein [Chromatiales bacterium]
MKYAIQSGMVVSAGAGLAGGHRTTIRVADVALYTYSEEIKTVTNEKTQLGRQVNRMLQRVGRAAWAAGAAMLGLLRELLAAMPDNDHDDRQLQDTDLIGEYNHRTGRLDAGNDPYGWYDED